jgi:phage terminase small subunit
VPSTAPVTSEGAPDWAQGLSLVERRFAEEFVVDLNGTEAALRAGLGKGNKKSASAVATRIRKRAEVAAAINYLLGQRTGVTGTGIISELGAIAFSRITDYLKLEKGRLVLAIDDLGKLPDEAKAAISKLRERVWEDGTITIEVELHDKIAALTLLGKSTGAFVERSEVRHTVTVETVQDVRDRVSRRLAQLGRNNAAAANPTAEIDPPPRRALPPAAKAGPVIEHE